MARPAVIYKQTPIITIIYTLTNPVDGLIFYVGATTRPLNRRLSQHISDCKNVIFHRLKKAGIRPIIEELERCEGYLAPMYTERYWIQQMKTWGFKLINQNLT